MQVVPVSPAVDPPSLRFAFDISLAVREGEEAWKRELEGVLDRKQTEIDRILAEYGVPVVPSLPERTTGSLPAVR